MMTPLEILNILHRSYPFTVNFLVGVMLGMVVSQVFLFLVFILRGITR